MIASISPPLRVWVLVGTIAGSLFAAAQIVSPPEPQETVDGRLEILRDQLDQMARKPDSPLVLFLGNSFLRRGVGSRQLAGKLTELLRANEPGAPKVQVQCLTANGLVMSHLRPVFEQVLSLEPALLVVEADLCFEGEAVDDAETRSHSSLWAESLRGSIGDALTAVLGFDVTKTDVPVEAPLEVDAGIGRRFLDLDEIPRWQGREATRDNPSYVAATEFLEPLQRDGPACAILVLPFSEKLRDQIGVFVENRNPLIDELARNHSVPLLKMSDYAKDRHFSDMRHMTAAGSRWFLRWLAPEVTRVLGPKLPE